MSEQEQPAASPAGHAAPKRGRAKANHAAGENGRAGERAETAATLGATGGSLGLPDEQPVTTIRDSLYERIPLGVAEHALIGSAPF
ncbi:MAG TPA: hypothetical protein VH540_16655, partial [Ktedonobacterales bacterium]